MLTNPSLLEGLWPLFEAVCTKVETVSFYLGWKESKIIIEKLKPNSRIRHNYYLSQRKKNHFYFDQKTEGTKKQFNLTPYFVHLI